MVAGKAYFFIADISGYTRFIAQRWLANLQDGKDIGTAADMEARFGVDASSLDERNPTP